MLKQGVVSDNDSEEMLTVQKVRVNFLLRRIFISSCFKSRVNAAINGLEGNKRKIVTLLESAGQVSRAAKQRETVKKCFEQLLNFDELQEVDD